ncbi:MAG: DUF3556 domain-containing protein [Spirochaetes bacterium]|nr:DUF3556 domain-containing protein [Spirochaetota bacterium]
MGFIKPTIPPYDALAWQKLPFRERVREACQAWALQGYGTPIGAYLLYVFKVVFYIYMWTFFVAFTPGLGVIADWRDWIFHPIAFQKAILWSMLFEVLGLGCGSGPLTGRYFPPVGGFLYFLRFGATKLSLFPKLPLFGGMRRTLFDVALYAYLLVSLVYILVQPRLTFETLLPVVIILPLLGVADQTLFLAARGEHYWTTAVCFLFVCSADASEAQLAGAKVVQLSLWFWAGFSKLNRHFPYVVGVMNSNSPFTRFGWMKKIMYKNFPDDVNPSTLARIAGHWGTAVEMGIPILFLVSPVGSYGYYAALALMLGLHIYITSNVPMGVPIEWNFMVVYAAFFLFGAYAEVPILPLPWHLGIFLFVMVVALPLIGNIYPKALSFLLSMRYYAGNWAASVWLFKLGSHKKLERLTTSARWVPDQLRLFYSEKETIAILSKVMAFRLMHLHGRAFAELIPQAVADVDDYEYSEGEVIAGQALGYNFGDGHLHDEKLAAALQAQCHFEPGEVRAIFLESEPLFKTTLAYRIHDLATGNIASGEIDAATLRNKNPWDLIPSPSPRGEGSNKSIPPSPSGEGAGGEA